MNRRLRRFLAVGITIVMIVITVVGMQQNKPQVYTIRVIMGLNDKTPSKWNGRIVVTGGRVEAIRGWRFEAKDKVLGTSAWRCKTWNNIKPGKRLPVNLAGGGKRFQPDRTPWPNGVTIVLKGNDPEVTLKLAQGNIKFSAKSIRLGEPQMFLKNQVRIERMPDTALVRPPAAPKTVNAVQDDYPAFWLHEKSGRQYLAWVCYQKERDQVLLTWRHGANGKWATPRVVAGPGHHFRVALSSTRAGKLWIVWSSQKKHNWDLYARSFLSGNFGKTIRLTKDPGPDIWHRMTTDNRGRAWLVWQGFRKGQADILAKSLDGEGWNETIEISKNASNDWNPCICADPKKTGRVWVGWDAYDGSNYGVRVRAVDREPTKSKTTLGKVLRPESTPLFQAHISLACDSAGRLWAAWDESGPQWGKDTGFLYGGQNRQDTTRLYASRTIRIKVLVNGKWLEPKVKLAGCLPENMKEYSDYPILQGDSEGRMWLAFRQRTCVRPREDGWAMGGRWDVYATAYLGDRWLAPIPLPQSQGRNDMRTSSQRDTKGRVFFAYASDNRPFFPAKMAPRHLSISVGKLHGAPSPKKMQLVDRSRNYPIVAPCHPREKQQVARIRKYKYEVGGKTYHVYRGDLHRHTDISWDGVGDGSLMDMHRYALDAAALDFIMAGDHNMGSDDEYSWWRTQHANDLYTVPGAFISMYGYERSVRFPRGHRNVIWTERGHRTLPVPKRPIPALMARDTDKLYAYLRRTGGICTLHTSASAQGTDWKDKIDPKLEPIVEIFQGFHAAYEADEAPKSVGKKTIQIHGRFRPEGFIANALTKGHKLGFQASSDHISTHVSYACMIAEKFTRKGLVEAMKKRHTYAATDNIIMDVRMGNHLMGDEVTTTKPKLKVVILGTGPIDRVEVIKDNRVVRTVRPNKKLEETRFEWADGQAVKGGNYFYYVRMIQQDGQMAWASPIWVRCK